mmetsp:Transcript_56184/g.93628  ORF Transcript_56184/g.93628 Transcript_56184/m.93628 type:complete len:526 (+) Transcript_56184:26-1603(+)
MASSLHRRFTNSRSAPKGIEGVQHHNDTVYFVLIGSKQKLKKTEIEDILGLRSFNRLHFFKCDSHKVYQIAFSYLMRHGRKIDTLEIYTESDMSSFSTALIQFIASAACSDLIKLSIHSPSDFDIEPLFSALTDSASLPQSLQCLQLQQLVINQAMKIDRAMAKYLLQSTVNTHTLQTLDLRNIRFSDKQTFDLSMALTQCLWSDQKRKRASQRCSITEFFFGGSDVWTGKGIQCMCDFIKYHHNLETLGIELLNGPKEKPFLSDDDRTNMGNFVLSIANHPSLQRLEIHHIQTYTLKMMGEQCEKRLKTATIKLNELFIQQVHQNTFANPMDHTVFPAISRLTKKIPWLQLLELRISVFCNLFEVKELCKLLPFCKHLNGLLFHCKLGEMFSKKQILGCVEHIVQTLKETKEKNVTQERQLIIDAIEQNLMIANEGNANVFHDIAVTVLSYADIAFAFDAGLLFFESTFLNKLDVKERIAAHEWLYNNWRRLPSNGQFMSDTRYRGARNKLFKFMQNVKQNNDK